MKIIENFLLALESAKLKTLTIIAMLSIKKENDPLSFIDRKKFKISLEDKIMSSLVITIAVTLLLFFGLMVFTSMQSEANFFPEIGLSFISLFIVIQLILLLFLAVFSLNGFDNNLKFLPSKLKSGIWIVKNKKNFSLSEAILNLETKIGEVKMRSIVWRLLLTLYISYAIFLVRLVINLLIKIFLFVIFLIIFPIFLLREIAHLNYYLLAGISLVLSIALLFYLQLNLSLVITISLVIFIIGSFFDMIIKTNLFIYLTKKMYNKIKFPVFIN